MAVNKCVSLVFSFTPISEVTNGPLLISGDFGAHFVGFLFLQIKGTPIEGFELMVKLVLWGPVVWDSTVPLSTNPFS